MEVRGDGQRQLTKHQSVVCTLVQIIVAGVSSKPEHDSKIRRTRTAVDAMADKN